MSSVKTPGKVGPRRRPHALNVATMKPFTWKYRSDRLMNQQLCFTSVPSVVSVGMKTNNKASGVVVVRALGGGGGGRSSPEELRQQLMRGETEATRSLKAELEARAAAMENLQQQLTKVEAVKEEELLSLQQQIAKVEELRREEVQSLQQQLTKVEELRNGELQSAAARFKELEEALADVGEAEEVYKLAAAEVVAAKEILEQAQALAEIKMQQGVDTSTPAAAAAAATTGGITEADVEALLDELDDAKAQLATALEIKERQEEEGEEKEHPDITALVKEAQAAKLAAAESDAKAAAVEIKLKAVEEELAAIANSNESAGGVFGGRFRNGSELEAELAALKKEMVKRDAILAQSRQFIESLLNQSRRN